MKELPQPFWRQIHELRPHPPSDVEGRRAERLLHRYKLPNQGYKINVKAIPIFHSLFFPTYETIKQKCREWDLSREASYFVSSIAAGSFCNFITNPIWVVRTRIMVQYLHP